MGSFANRLVRIEKSLRRMNAGLCRLCYGTPVAALYVECEPDPHGPGLRDTGVVILDAGWANRVTDDLCCRACGKPAIRLIVRTHRGLGEPPAGRLLKNFERSDAGSDAQRPNPHAR
jgi:hypothetical protein